MLGGAEWDGTMKISCEEIRENLSAWLDGELSPEMAAVIENHVAECQSCKALASDLRAVSGLLSNLPHRGAPSGLSEDIVGRLERRVLLADLDEPQGIAPHVTDRGLARRRPSLWPRVVAVAACVALIAGIAALQMRGGEDVRSVGGGGGELAGLEQGQGQERYAEAGRHEEMVNGLDELTVAGAGEAADGAAGAGGALGGTGLRGVDGGPDLAGAFGSALPHDERRLLRGNTLVVRSETDLEESHEELKNVAGQLSMRLKMVERRVVRDGDEEYVVSTYNGVANGEQVAALNFYIANSTNLDVAEGSGLFAAAPQNQQMSRIANSYAPELSQKVQREATLQQLGRIDDRYATRQGFSQRLRQMEPADIATTGRENQAELQQSGAAEGALGDVASANEIGRAQVGLPRVAPAAKEDADMAGGMPGAPLAADDMREQLVPGGAAAAVEEEGRSSVAAEAPGAPEPLRLAENQPATAAEEKLDDGRDIASEAGRLQVAQAEVPGSMEVPAEADLQRGSAMSGSLAERRQAMAHEWAPMRERFEQNDMAEDAGARAAGDEQGRLMRPWADGLVDGWCGRQTEAGVGLDHYMDLMPLHGRLSMEARIRRLSALVAQRGEPGVDVTAGTGGNVDGAAAAGAGESLESVRAVDAVEGEAGLSVEIQVYNRMRDRRVDPGQGPAASEPR